MNQLNLVFHEGFSWLQRKGISFRGYIFDKEGNYLKGEDAIYCFDAINDPAALADYLKEIDGCFTVLIQQQDKVIAGVDTLSFFSLFYTFDKGKWLISDNWYEVRKLQEKKKKNLEAFPEFLAGGFVQGNETLGKDIFKTRPGSVITFEKDGKVNSLDYYNFLPWKFYEMDYQALEKELQGILDNVSQRLIKSLEGRTAVVPLSGGYDSRLIACMLKKAAYKDVICITYGRPGFETQTSRRVASALGYKWYYIDYTELDAKDFFNDQTFCRYYKYAANGFSMPYLQEYPATKLLKERGIIPHDAVFIPGHSGDWLAGSYLEKTIDTPAKINKLPPILNDLYFRLTRLKSSSSRLLNERILRELKDQSTEKHLYHPVYNVLVENWDLKQKLPRFIFNSSHVFTFFGHQIRFPLWDKELRDFFRSTPFEFRTGQLLYNKVLEAHYFEPSGVNFRAATRENKSLPLPLRRIKRKIKDYLPMSYIVKRLRKHDNICYEKFTSELERQLKNEGKKPLKRYYCFNARICNWYLSKI